MRKLLRLFPLMIIAAGTTACLQKDTHHTLYLSSDGAVAWTAMENDVTSDETDPASRATEERDFLAAAGNGEHAVALGLYALGALDVRTRILRAERPYIVMTDARFDRIDTLANAVLKELCVPGVASLARSGDRLTLSVHLAIPEEEEEMSGQSAVTALMEDLDRYRIVLTNGSFTAADGFALQSNGSVAVGIPRDDEEIRAHGGTLDLSLTWSAQAGSTR